ncbi:MAG: tRNA-queuosine alpha-mannosyltransferase domain-containing protein, partial [Anaerolineales bacterium]
MLALEPYFGLSHRTFLEGYRRYSGHEVEIWSLPPRKWKWRMRGSAYHFAERARALGEEARFDALLTSDFLNLPDWRSLAPARMRGLPALVYFHENQITYPLGKNAPIDFHYGWINVSTALAADRVLFNSQYHREEFFAAVRAVFRRMPDHVPEKLLEALPARTGAFPV